MNIHQRPLQKGRFFVLQTIEYEKNKKLFKKMFDN